MLRGVYETHLDVTDLDRALAFYTGVLGLEVGIRRTVDAASGDAHSRGARQFALLWVGEWGHSMVGLWERDPDRIRPQHFAFEVALGELERLIGELHGKGIEFRDFFQTPTTTPSVFGFIPAASIYFTDPDGHVLELLARIPAAPRPEVGVLSWMAWTHG